MSSKGIESLDCPPAREGRAREGGCPWGTYLSSVAVSKNEVHPGLHPEEDLSDDGQMVHMVCVNCDLGAAAGHDHVLGQTFFWLNQDEDAPFAFDLFRINQIATGLE